MDDEQMQEKGFAWLPPESSFENLCSVGSLPDRDKPKAPPGAWKSEET